jgi:NADPH-dependent 2,4-dienoyl-CoA reductase/sulfur reductase-like enzyme
MTTSVPAPEAPAEPKRGRLGLVIIGIVCAVAAGGFGFIAAHVGQTPGIDAQLITYDAGPSSIEVNFSVAKPKGDVVHCTLQAFDENMAVIAKRDVTVPAGTSKAGMSETLPTPGKATSAQVQGCRKA